MITLAYLQVVFVTIGFIIMFTSLIILEIYFVKQYKAYKKIKHMTYELSKDINNQNVLDYIEYIDKVDIPPKIHCWNLLISGYKLVELNQDIDNEIKLILRVTMLGKGVVI